jgi:outer membrane lipoprotein LolB
MSSVRLVFVLLAALLAGCSSLDSQTQYNESVWRGQRESLEKLHDWNLTGKLAIYTPGQKGSARLNWQQHGDDYDLILTSLIGTTIMELHRLNGTVELIDAKGNHHTGNDMDTLAYQLTGWPIPVSQLPTWIKGLPGDADYQLGADGRIESLSSQQWQLLYSGYERNRLWLLPTGMTLQGPQQTRIKLVINEWQIAQ